MKKLRKVNSKKRKKERQEAQEQLATQTSMMMKHPTECCLCGTGFERSMQNVKTWHVTVTEDRCRLTCPSCSRLVQETVEKHNAD